MNAFEYAITVDHNPFRFWRRWEARVIERRRSHLWQEPPLLRYVDPDKPIRAFTRSGAIFAAQLVVDEARRQRQRQLEAEVMTA